jgi:hypothetical protein
MKRARNQGYCLMRGLPAVRAETRLTVVAYNLKRVITILGVPALLTAVLTNGSRAVNATIMRIWLWVSGIPLTWCKSILFVECFHTVWRSVKHES